VNTHTPTHARRCPLLERATDSRILPEAPPPWILRECAESGFVWLENPPDYAAFREAFAWESTYENESERRRAAEPRLQQASSVLKRFRHRVLKRNKVQAMALGFLAGRRGEQLVVDVGCAWAHALAAIARTPPAGITVIPCGIEISTELARLAGEQLAPLGGRILHNNAIDGLAELAEDSADLIILSSFLEHEINPLPLLRTAGRKLRRDGALLIKVPNYASWNRRLRGAKWCGYRFPDHVNYFTPATLSAMLERAGLAVRRMNFFDRLPVSDSLYAVAGRRD
jgi:SAM-dependent methyltransferase